MSFTLSSSGSFIPAYVRIGSEVMRKKGSSNLELRAKIFFWQNGCKCKIIVKESIIQQCVESIKEIF